MLLSATAAVIVETKIKDAPVSATCSKFNFFT